MCIKLQKLALGSSIPSTLISSDEGMGRLVVEKNAWQFFQNCVAFSKQTNTKRHYIFQNIYSIEQQQNTGKEFKYLYSYFIAENIICLTMINTLE